MLDYRKNVQKGTNMKLQPKATYLIWVCLAVIVIFAILDFFITTIEKQTNDPHSFSEPQNVSVEHLVLDVLVDFSDNRLIGTANWQINNPGGSILVLDTRDLEIYEVRVDGNPVEFALGKKDPVLGQSLSVKINADTQFVSIDYSTQNASGLQWLDGSQTGTGKPFLYSQAQMLHARSFIPCQDSPQVRFTFDATVQVPSDMMAVMGADGNPTKRTDSGIYRFKMEQPIPSYLLALAVGDLEFRSTGPRTGVYADPSIVEAAAWELAETESMLAAAEDLYGPYLWGRYDILILPPSFPYGAMENPRLTFATSTLLIGDRSQVYIIAHEIAHSWFGNLVTNATWDDFWINEGMTMYATHRLVEAIYGPEYDAEFRTVRLGKLEETLAQLDGSPDAALYLQTAGRDPEQAFSYVQYDKGTLFLTVLEEYYGRERLDAFLRDWSSENGFTSKTTADFLRYLRLHLLEFSPNVETYLKIHEWVYGMSLPRNFQEPHAFRSVKASAEEFMSGGPAADINADGWSVLAWVAFLQTLHDLNADQMAELDAAFSLTGSRNPEVLVEWFKLAISARYEPAYPRMREFMTQVGRIAYLKPLYERLVETGQKKLALEIFEEASPGYHPIATTYLTKILDT